MSKECNVSVSARADLNLVAVRLSPHGDYKPDPVVDLVHNPEGGSFRASFPLYIFL